VSLLNKAHDWFERLRLGRSDSVRAIARKEQVTGSYVARVIQLAFLAPDIVQRIQRAEHPLELNAQGLLRMVPLPLAWEEQRALLGMTG
jgi:site-specific DNA recombinase